MTVTAPTEVRRDAKAGYCSMCRSGTHGLCAAPRCTCPTGSHPNRPAARPAPAAEVRSSRPRKAPARKARAPRTEPVWELAKEDPPAPPPKPEKPRKLTPAELAQPLLEAIVDAGDRGWHRIALFGSQPNAGRVKAVLAKQFTEWEWKATRDSLGRPAVFARWTPPEA